MKKILLINPWIEDVAAYDFWLKPLGLLYISSILKEGGIETALIDLLDRHDKELESFTGKKSEDKYYGTGNFHSEVIEKPDCLKNIPRKFKRYGFPEILFRKKLQKYRGFDAVFVTSMMTYWHYGVRDTIQVIKEELPDKPVVLGGVYASILPGHALSHSGADFISPGTGILPVSNALKFLGIEASLKENFLQELDPDYSHYDLLSYAVLITSTGCPYHCNYCMSWKLWDAFSRRSPEKTAGTIENLYLNKGVKDIVFFDDAILIGPGFRELLKILDSKELKLRYHLPNGVHARLVDVETAKLMKKVNFKTIKLGYETSNAVLQEKTGGKVFDMDLVKAVSNLKLAGFSGSEISAYIIANLPGQSVEDVERAIDKCDELGIIPVINEFTPIPGTPQWRELVETGKLPENIDPLMLDNSLLPYWWTEGITATSLRMLKEKAWKVRERIEDEDCLSRLW
ncbi:radical SAM protein [Kosmotoga arenicorallina S304]|uniref:Radical SAM protein n=1 Tax=Kosmotoga arenicorallina S304 TaxID=1453497 RepID=A0A182C8G5_9BACT|nr:B12-binding domain-containing radical SAM protein [Kosmotoga arenicorallina]OAA31803.1 radical SAM protein [Kosmotoga arenicorallina S304]